MFHLRLKGGGLSGIHSRRFYHHRVSHSAAEHTGSQETTMALTELPDFTQLVATVRRTPHQYLWSSYDAEADVLYISFKFYESNT
jgi:hypothetical protein